MDNRVASKALTHKSFTDEAIATALQRISEHTGFVATAEVARRTLYDADKVWRVRFVGSYKGEPASLRIENMRLETDEEKIRQAFRAQGDFRIRPPKTYAHGEYIFARNYAWSIEEDASKYKKLYEPDADPCHAVRAFAEMYHRLVTLVRYPFWMPDGPGQDACSYSWVQMQRWMTLAREKHPEWLEAILAEGRKDGDRHVPLVQDVLGKTYMRLGVWKPLRFMHAHLCGDDVRVSPVGDYVVFANHFWSWRQPGYDVAFAVWHQWMHLPLERRTPAGIRQVTENWLSMLTRDQRNGGLKGLVEVGDVWTMLLNRLYGALLLDLPARRATETPEMVEALKTALFAESRRLLTSNRL